MINIDTTQFNNQITCEVQLEKSWILGHSNIIGVLSRIFY